MKRGPEMTKLLIAAIVAAILSIAISALLGGKPS